MTGCALSVPDSGCRNHWWRQPFLGSGLAVRIIGDVTAERLSVLREADATAREELTAGGLDGDVWQCPVVLLAAVRSVGVQGDGRTYGHPIVLRPVSSEDAMTADWSRVAFDVLARISTRITNEVREVNRVVLDITSEPPPALLSGSKPPRRRARLVPSHVGVCIVCADRIVMGPGVSHGPISSVSAASVLIAEALWLTRRD